MSANNYSVCPRCTRSLNAEIIALEKKAEESYGKVSVTEFEHLRRKAAEARLKAHERENFRQDYEIIVSRTGLFSVNFHGECSACWLKFIFKIEQQIPL